MSMTRSAVCFALCYALALGAFSGESEPESNIELKLTLPKGDTYTRAGSDPVDNLLAEVTLANKTAKEDLVAKSETVPEVARLTAEEIAKLKTMSEAEQKALIEKKKGTREIKVQPINEKSLGYSYIEPMIGPSDTVEFIITKLPDEGETVPEGAKPVTIARDNTPDYANIQDVVHGKYLPAGETSPPYTLQVGKYYVIRSAGMYSIKAFMRSIPDPKSPAGYAMSNEEKFRVLPFKKVDVKIDELKSHISLYERGYPDYEYMIYQVAAEANYDEVYCVQRVSLRGVDRWEWNPVCSVKTGTQAQLAQLGPKKVALLAVHHKGDAGLYTLDFSAPGVKVDAKIMPLKEGATPKLKVEGGNLSVE